MFSHNLKNTDNGLSSFLSLFLLISILNSEKSRNCKIILQMLERIHLSMEKTGLMFLSSVEASMIHGLSVNEIHFLTSSSMDHKVLQHEESGRVL